MEKQIKGKRYNTDSAKFVTIIELNNNACAVYLKKTNELFCQNLETEEIIILSPTEQQKILAHNEVRKRIEEITKFMKAQKIQINPYITIQTRQILTSLAEEKGQTESEIVEKAIIELQKEEKRLVGLREKAIENFLRRRNYFT